MGTSIYSAGALLFALAIAAQASPLAYISNEGSNDVSVIDTGRNALVATIPVGNAPYGIAVSAAGDRIYVANRSSDEVSVIDASTHRVVATVSVGRLPFGIAAHPAHTRVYVGNLLDDAVSVIDTATNTAVATVRVQGHPQGLAVSPDGRRLYVGTTAPNRLVEVDTETNRVASKLTLPGLPYAIVVTRNGGAVYVAMKYESIFNFNPPPPCDVRPGADAPPCWPESGHIGLVVGYDARSFATITTLTTTAVPFGLALGGDEDRIHVSFPGASMVATFDLATRAMLAQSVAAVAPYGLAMHPDRPSLYVADHGAGTVVVLDAETLATQGSIRAGLYPVALGAFMGPPAALPAIEYFHAGFGHYFVTALPSEVAVLDSSRTWTRTGASYGVAPLNAPATAPVCRFWSGAAFTPKSSHFYTADAAECASVKTRPEWIFEGERFALTPADVSGSCGPGFLALYRLFNNGWGGAPNHRYTTSRQIRDQMLSLGWTAEGQGLGVAGCVRPPGGE